MLPEAIEILPPQFDALSFYGILVIAVCVAIAWVYLFSLRRLSRGIYLGFLTGGVMLVSAIAARAGLLSSFEHFPPPMMVMIVSVFAVGLGFGFSPLGREGAARLSFASLIGLQVFRFPLELVMHHAGSVEIMPVQLSFSGYNFDIVTGVTAMGIVFSIASGRNASSAVVWAWNIWGSLCLIVIAVIAVTTSPMVRLFGDAPRDLNTWVLYFPYVWLPVVLVTVAVAGHVVVTRKLLMEGAAFQGDAAKRGI